MSVYATRKFRNAAAMLMMLSGITHVGQLWFRDTTPLNLATALIGMYYLLLALGLSGRSRFTLWITSVSVLAGAAATSSLWTPGSPNPLLLWHLTADALVAALCLYLLFRTRYADMD